MLVISVALRKNKSSPCVRNWPFCVQFVGTTYGRIAGNAKKRRSRESCRCGWRSTTDSNAACTTGSFQADILAGYMTGLGRMEPVAATTVHGLVTTPTASAISSRPHHHRVPTARASRASASAGAEIGHPRTSDSSAGDSPLPPPLTSAAVRSAALSTPDLNKTLQTPSKTCPWHGRANDIEWGHDDAKCKRRFSTR